MFMRGISTVLFCIMITLYLLNVNQIQEKIFQGIKIGLELTIKHLIDLHVYFGNEFIEYNISKSDKENQKQSNINEVQNDTKCSDHRYKIRLIARSPLIIYIEKFLTENEIKHLIELAEPLFQLSTMYDNNGKVILNKYRTSTTADIERHETPIVRCLEERFAQFQGNIDLERLEPLQVVKYIESQEFKPHFDWFPDSNINIIKDTGQRVTTFFTYLQSNCSQGETEFPNIRFNKAFHKRFCDILICDKNSPEYGIRFRPLSGNSIFWFNVDEQGQGDQLTYHAGRPPAKDGYKIGLNTWTRSKHVSVRKRN